MFFNPYQPLKYVPQNLSKGKSLLVYSLPLQGHVVSVIYDACRLHTGLYNTIALYLV